VNNGAKNSRVSCDGAAERKPVTNKFEAVTCQACGRKVKRKSRQQRYCSDRCREYAKAQGRVRKTFLGTDTGVTPDPLFLTNKNNGLHEPKTASSIPINVVGGYRWPNAPTLGRELLRKVVRAEVGGTTI
jgi:hypothetical protein